MQNNKRTGFTMIELVFVIVVIGILAAIAIPKLSATRDDAHIAKARSDIAAIRAAIVSERQGRFMQGQSTYLSQADHAAGAASVDGELLFDDNDTNVSNGVLLQYGIASGSDNGSWRKTANNTYQYRVMNVDTQFEYNTTTGRFNCTAGSGNCDILTQ